MDGQLQTANTDYCFGILFGIERVASNTGRTPSIDRLLLIDEFDPAVGALVAFK